MKNKIKLLIKYFCFLLFIMFLFYFFRYNEYDKNEFSCSFIKFSTYILDSVFTLLKSYTFVGLIVFLFLRKAISSLISRLKIITSNETSLLFENLENNSKEKIGYNGLSKDNVNVININTKTSHNKGKINFIENVNRNYQFLLGNPNLKVAIEEQYDKLSKDFDIKNDVSSNKVSDALLKILADFSLALYFEKILRIIFRSQLEALLSLYINSNKMLTNEDIFKEAYTNAVNMHSDAYKIYNYESWINFLLSQNFIVIKDNDISITNIGRAFCFYFLNQNYNVGMVTQL